MRSVFVMVMMLFSASPMVWGASASVKGCVAVFQGSTPISIEVELPPFSGGLFRTNQFHFSHLPDNLIPDDRGRYCYSMQDERFAYVQAYYYAVKEIEDYNTIFKKLGLPLGKTLEWTLERKTNLPSLGDTNLTHGNITYSNPAIDPDLLHHEIGHWVHHNAKRNNGGGDEGAANLLAVLHSGNPIQGKMDGYYNSVISYDVDTFIQYPDHMISTLQVYKQTMEDPFLKKFPLLTESLQKALELAQLHPEVEAMLNEPDPYVSSSIINQPLWQAAMHYGVDLIKSLYIKTIAVKLNKPRAYSFSEIAKALVEQANEMNPELGLVLQREYQIRGILNVMLPMPIDRAGCRLKKMTPI